LNFDIKKGKLLKAHFLLRTQFTLHLGFCPNAKHSTARYQHDQVKNTFSTTLEEASDALVGSFKLGFDVTVDHATTLFPNMDFSALKPLKEVVAGQIVDG